jgi:sterol desaturase/sphingolipid hydroxylase (fatty acid hydroxylase superfamily)
MFWELLDGFRVGLQTMAFMFGLCIAIEYIAPIERYTMKDRIPGLTFQVVGMFAGFAFMWPIQTLWQSMGATAWMLVPLWDWLKPLGAVGYALHFLAILTIADFLAYWRHRAEHSRWLWPVHAVHHAPTELHAANNLAHPIQGLFSLVFITIPVTFIQFPGPELPLAVGLVVGLLAIYIHSPVDFYFGRASRVIVDNRFHRIHHSAEPHHVDRNFGIWLSCWDYMFGTAYTPKPGEWPKVVGIGFQPPRNVREFLLYPYLLLRQQANELAPVSYTDNPAATQASPPIAS